MNILVLAVCVCPAPFRGCSHRAAVSIRKVRNNGSTWTYTGAVTKHFHVPEICQPELQLGKNLFSNLTQWNPISLWKLLHFRKLGERIFIICLQQLCVFSQITLAYRKWYWMCVRGKSYVPSVDTPDLVSLYLMCAYADWISTMNTDWLEWLIADSRVRKEFCIYFSTDVVETSLNLHRETQWALQISSVGTYQCLHSVADTICCYLFHSA